MTEDTLISGLAILLIGGAIYFALRLLYGLSGPAPGDPVYALLSVLSRVLLIVGVGTILISGGGLLGMLLSGLGVVILIDAWLVSRRTRSRTLLALVATLIDRRAPLVPALEGFAAEHRGRPGRAARLLAEQIKQGVPTPAAVLNCGGAFPPLTPTYVAVGEATGALAPALREAALDENSARESYHAIAGRTTYLAFVLLIGSGVMTFQMLKVVPAFARIFYDFELELPALTHWVIGMADLFATALVVILPLAFFAALLCGLAFLSGARLVMPWSRPLYRAGVLRLFALAVEHRSPLHGVMTVVADTLPARSIGRRLSRAAERIGAGDHWTNGLRSAKIIDDADQALLKSAERAGNLDWALRLLADAKRGRAVRLLEGCMNILFPLFVLVIGLAVLLFIAGMFLPLVKVITAIAE